MITEPLGQTQLFLRARSQRRKKIKHKLGQPEVCQIAVWLWCHGQKLREIEVVHVFEVMVLIRSGVLGYLRNPNPDIPGYGHLKNLGTDSVKVNAICLA